MVLVIANVPKGNQGKEHVVRNVLDSMVGIYVVSIEQDAKAHVDVVNGITTTMAVQPRSNDHVSAHTSTFVRIPNAVNDAG